MGKFVKGFGIIATSVVLASTHSPVVAQDNIISDFQNKGFDFSYGSWDGNITIGPEFLTINSATESGGAGAGSFQSGSSLSLTPGPTYFLQIDLRKVSGNLADAVNVLLEDGDGTMAGWRFDLSSVDETDFLTLTKELTPDFINPPNNGTADGVFDPSSIIAWQVQGDFSSDDAFALQIKNLQIIPEPSTAVLLATGLLGLLGFNRLRNR